MRNNEITKLIEELKWKYGEILPKIETSLSNFIKLDDVKDYIYNIIEIKPNPKHGESTFEKWIVDNPNKNNLSTTKISDLKVGEYYKRLAISSPILKKYNPRVVRGNKLHEFEDGYICIIKKNSSDNDCISLNKNRSKLFLFKETGILSDKYIVYLGEHKN